LGDLAEGKGQGEKGTQAQTDGASRHAPRVRTDRDNETLQGRDHDHHNVAAEKAYLVETDEGIYRVTVPADWLITFGPMYISTKRFGNRDMSGVKIDIPTALRFYEGKHQRACLLNVSMFRDLSIKVEMPVIRKGKDVDAIKNAFTNPHNVEWGEL
jgi:hypothetical protein